MLIEANSRLMWWMMMPITNTPVNRSSSTPTSTRNGIASSSKQAEQEDPVLQEQVAEHLHDRLPARRQHEEAGPHRGERGRHEQQAGVLLGQGKRVREHQRQAGADRPQQERTHVVHDRLDLVLDVRLAHGVDEERRDDESLQADGHDDQQDAAEADLRVDEDSGRIPSRIPWRATALMTAANPAHAQGDEVERQGHDQQGIEKLDHRFTSPAG